MQNTFSSTFTGVSGFVLFGTSSCFMYNTESIVKLGLNDQKKATSFSILFTYAANSLNLAV